MARLGFLAKTKARLFATVTAATCPALEIHVEPYLAEFATVESLIPYIEHPYWATLLGGVALDYVDSFDKNC